MLLPAGRWVGAWFLALLLVSLTVLALLRETNSPSDYSTTAAPASSPADTTPAGISATDVEPSHYVGVILPAEAVEVTAKLNGQISEIRVRSGDRVQRGFILATLESVEVTRADLTMAEAEQRSAEAEVQRLGIELAQARERLRRTTSLSERQLVPAEQLDDVRYQEQLTSARANSAESAVVQKRALVEQRKTLLANLQVRAPFDGFVSVRYVERGWNVGLGTPIVRLVRASPLKLRFAVPTSESSLLRVGAPVTARIEDIGVTLAGTIETVSPEVDSASQMLVAEAVIETAQEEHVASMQALAGRIAAVTLVRADQSTRRVGSREEPMSR